MQARDFIDALQADFFAGVPDSQLKHMCNFLLSKYGQDPQHHVIAANEGNCVGLAAGYHLATGKVPVVYMQNSGEGNAVNPITSLTSPDVYAIPVVFVIGWRGEPGVHDEPQHAQQGRVTNELLDVLGIAHMKVDTSTEPADIVAAMEEWQPLLAEGKSVAFVVGKGALQGESGGARDNGSSLTRECAVELVAQAAGEDPIVSTTGKISRELFEIRERAGQDHSRDFLTVGSMGHASSIALGIAAQKPEKLVWCVDGDGAVLMHMGSLAHAGNVQQSNFVHVLMNNEAHESVGGYPTVGTIDFPAVALACGYKSACSVDTEDSLREKLLCAREAENRPAFIEVKCAIGSRGDLGRPTTTPRQNKEAFMKHLED